MWQSQPNSARRANGPGIYEVHFGTKLSQVLEMAEAADPAAVQVSGPSGQMVAGDAFDRAICFDDHARDIVASLKSGREYYKLPHELGDGNNAHKLVHSSAVAARDKDLTCKTENM